MYTIQINHDDYPAELSPACEVFTSAHVSEAAAVWQFMIDNLRPGWSVTLLDVAGDVVKTAEATEPYSHHRQPATGSHDTTSSPFPAPAGASPSLKPASPSRTSIYLGGESLS